jgi:hypothetical protein
MRRIKSPIRGAEGRGSIQWSTSPGAWFWRPRSWQRRSSSRSTRYRPGGAALPADQRNIHARADQRRFRNKDAPRRLMWEELMWDGLATSGAADMTMPLRAYFVTVGPALLALLLFLNVILEPSKPDSPSPAAAALTAAVSKNTAKPRLTTGSAEPNGTAFLTAPAVEPQRQTMSSPEPQLSAGEAEPKLVTQAKPKSKTRAAARRDDRSAYSSYARGAWNFSAATRHGPE